MILADSSYPLLNLFWIDVHLFLWVIWIWILIWVFIDIFRIRPVRLGQEPCAIRVRAVHRRSSACWST